MRFRKERLRFALDEGVPNAVGLMLKEAGHSVVFFNSGELLPRGSADKQICTASIEMNRILVALDGDMREIAKKAGITKSGYSKLSLLKISCSEPLAADRLKDALSLIEHEWFVGRGRQRRLFVEVSGNIIRSVR